MKSKLITTIVGLMILCITALIGCDVPSTTPQNTSALAEQAHTEYNQRDLLQKQPPPTVTWSMERDNLIKRFKLQNDRTVMFYMYVFIEGVAQPIGYYQVNKLSSVNSQLTNTMQIISGYSASNNLPGSAAVAIPSPAEDGSYGSNGEGMFGFTPDDVYIETDMHYVISTIPLTFEKSVIRLGLVNTEEAKQLLSLSKQAMK